MSATLQTQAARYPRLNPRLNPRVQAQGITQGLNPGLQPAQARSEALIGPTVHLPQNGAQVASETAPTKDDAWVCWHCGHVHESPFSVQVW
jgi:hypothetical protein